MSCQHPFVSLATSTPPSSALGVVTVTADWSFLPHVWSRKQKCDPKSIYSSLHISVAVHTLVGLIRHSLVSDCP